MNALLIIVIIALQDDGSVTQQRQMFAKDSMVACQLDAQKRMDELMNVDGPTRHIDMRCEPMATLEVIKPAPVSEPNPKRPIVIKPDASRTGT